MEDILTIRDMNESDLSVVTELLSYLMRVDAVKDIQGEIDYVIQERVKPILENRKPGKIFIVQDGKKAIGALILELKRRVGFIAYVVVDPEYQQRGIGRALIGHASEFAKNQGAVTLEANIFKANPNSRKFHESIGFELYGYIFRRKLQ